ncbi:hypothetical protein E5Q_04485 [Mixia osmundae IAM 14324]|uniref:Acyl-CoA thioesterase II domain-containing protein n=1 Tax=Mixia osmundae (strain CBS 9802 / IAM 14324 / JCM 22182 / KY 12970) TaxID=764103 RepID=G7E4P6_MIXOS|nr:hypothetical protein E5Q_04485 [Mixia osmundae IAM 14324]
MNKRNTTEVEHAELSNDQPVSTSQNISATTAAEETRSPETISEALELETIDTNLFRSKRLWKPLVGRGVFGGQVIAMAVVAATASVEPLKHLHSLHAYFLSFGNADRPIIYTVDRLRDGKSYATRSVKAIQDGRCIFSLTCSFQVPEPSQPVFQIGRPKPDQVGRTAPLEDYPQPEECQPIESRFIETLEQNPNLPVKLKAFLENAIDERQHSAIEIRIADPARGGPIGMGVKSPTQAYWFRSRTPVPKDPAFQKGVLAYASDFQLISTAGNALGLSGRSTPRLAMMASLDHSMYFYNDFDCSEWLFYHMECPRAAHGRGVVTGRIFTQDGKLAIVVAQEGVVRANL